MIDVVSLIQNTLDSGLASIPLYSFWLIRQDVDEDPNLDEYVVYTGDLHEPDIGADGEILIFRSKISVYYTCRGSWIGEGDQFETIQNRLSLIRNTMTGGGFDAVSGWNDLGDIDNLGFKTFLMSFEYVEVDYGVDGVG